MCLGPFSKSGHIYFLSKMWSKIGKKNKIAGKKIGGKKENKLVPIVALERVFRCNQVRDRNWCASIHFG